MEVSALHPSNLEALAIPQFGELSRAERDMLRAAAKGDFPSFGNSAIWDDPSNDPAQADSWGGERVIRAELIRWLCLNEEASRQVDVRGSELPQQRSPASWTYPMRLFASPWPSSGVA